MAPPTKRRRTTVLSDSDDEGVKPRQQNTLANYLFSSPNSKSSPSRAPTASPSPVKPRGKAAAQSTRTSRNTTASPEKKRGAGKRGKEPEKGKSADILTLFSRQVHNAANRSSKPTTPVILDDDIVSDPIDDDDDDVADKRASISSFVGQNARKRARDGTQTTSAPGLSASTKFLKPPRPATQPTLDDDLRPWSERFAPVNLDELAVHKRKVADVRKWLEDVMGGRMRQRLLILKGAAGSGKTTTMRLLARDLGCELLEWRNPAGSMGANLGYSSASAQFQEFLGRGGKFGQLDTDMMSPEPPRSSSTPQQQDSSSKRIIMIEEFPNTFARSSTALTSFRNAILGYLASNTPSLATFGRQPPGQQVTPVVMIISETLLTTTSASADSFTAHRLLGPEILRHPGARLIEFNAIAPSILSKALELVVMKEARKSGRRRTPGPLVLKRLGEIGDIRSAISSLEFLCLKGDSDTDWGARVMFTKPKKSVRDAIGLTRTETESLEMISQREASLGIFHAVGKVVYNKRDDVPPPGFSRESVPDHLARYMRPQRSQVSVDSLIDETGTDTHTFVSALHENYALSCQSWSPESWSLSALDNLNGCIDYLSESDLMSPSWDVFFGGKGFAGGYSGKDSGSHVLRQDEMAFQVAVRGLLFSLPSPVHRKAPAGGKGADAYKMFYPTSIKLWRSKEEFEGLVDAWSTSLLKGEESAPRKDLTQGAAMFRRAKPVNSENWIANRQTNSGPKNTRQEEDENEAVPLLSLGSAARREMLLERLPYMAQIVRGRKGAFHSMKLKDIEKVVSFTGIGGQQAGDESGDEAMEDDGGPMTGEAWATDKPSEDSSPRKKAARIRTRSNGSVSGLAVQGLVLSDDDIEDEE